MTQKIEEEKKEEEMNGNHNNITENNDKKEDPDTDDEKEDDASSPLKAKKNVFVRSDEHAWLPARLLEQSSENAAVQVFEPQADGTMKLSPDEQIVDLMDYPNSSLPLKNVNPHGDMIDLPFLHEPGILYNLRSRYCNDQPYTRTGDILIAVNPYQWLEGLYTTQQRKRYMPNEVYDTETEMVHKSIDPHVYEISAMAFRGLAQEGKNQSILVSGESGAGKTETVKICLDHIATIQGGLKRHQQEGNEHQVMSSIVQRVVDSNPLLEAFGNAKTVRNDNSSRFGKFVQLQFDPSSGDHDITLVGSHIEVYLLEKSRVVSHAAGERNFHIFYQLLGASDEMKQHFGADMLIGKSTESFPYTSGEDFSANDMSMSTTITTSSSSKKDSKEYIIIKKKLAKVEKMIAESTDPKEKKKLQRKRTEYASKLKAEEEEEVKAEFSGTRCFEQTVKELKGYGIQGETLNMLVRALCIVLQLGTIEFVGDNQDHAMIHPTQTSKGGRFEVLANLMGTELDGLKQAFLNKTILVGDTEITSPLSPQQAEEGCNAYAKDLYSKIFSYLVGTINAATSASPIHTKGITARSSVSTPGDNDDGTPKHGTIGVLDIFGFEAFEKNQFEQLCINYANERLQYMFASNVFVSLIDEYTREGLVVDFSYETNTNVLSLIGGKAGILAILNEECIRPGGSDVEFVYKALDQNKHSQRMFKTKQFTRYQFGVKHYAGPVVYTANEFCSTNKDLMPIDLQKVSRSSTNKIIAAEYSEQMDISNCKKVHRTRTNMVKSTVASKFREQLNSLLKTLSSTQTRYIRCIKPNRMKQPTIMENMEILRQLQSGGVIAAIKIASASYPNKMEHHAVLKRFRNLADKPDQSQDVKIQVSTLLAIALKDFISPIKGGTPRPPATLGKTRTYFRTGALEYLENQRNENIGFFAIIIQRNYRMSPVRKLFLVQRRAAVNIQAIMRRFVWKQRVEKMPHCALVIQCFCRCVLAKRKLQKHNYAVKIQRQWCIARGIIRVKHRKKAAISIQKNLRGYIDLSKFRKELAQKTRAVILFQKVTRGRIQLVKFLESKKASVQIQRIIRGCILRLKFKAATNIQKIARSCSQRAKYRISLEEDKARKTKAAIRIQKTARAFIQYLKYQVIKKAEEERIAAEETAKEARLKAERLAAEEAAESERLEAEKVAEETRLIAKKLAEKKRIAAAHLAKKDRLAAEKKAEEEKLAEEKCAKEEKLAAEKKAEEERLAAEERAKRAKEEKLAAEKKAEEERLAAEERAKDERLAAERTAKEERLAAEKKAEEELNELEKTAAERDGTEKEEEKDFFTVETFTLEERLAAAERRAEEERLKAEKLAAENSHLKDRIDESDAIEKAIQIAQKQAAADNELNEEPDNDEELELAMEMALLAGQNPELSSKELNKLLGKTTNSIVRGFIGRMRGGFGQVRKTIATPAPLVDTPPCDSSSSSSLDHFPASLSGKSVASFGRFLGSPRGRSVSSLGHFLSPGNRSSVSSLSQFMGSPGGRSSVSSLGQFLVGPGGRSVSNFNDDDTFADSVMTMMLPGSLTAEELRSRRVDFKAKQEIRKLQKEISEKSRDLRKLRSQGDKARAGNKKKTKSVISRHETASIKLKNWLQGLTSRNDDFDSDIVKVALEKASIAHGLGSFEDQKNQIDGEEKSLFDAQNLQEAVLVVTMREMHSMGLQKFLHEKHAKKDIDYMKSCKTRLSDCTDMNTKVQKLESTMKEMKTLYEETLWRQEAAFARHDPNMTIRETIEDLF